MATVHFSAIKDVRVEIHEMPNIGRTAIHFLLDTQPFIGETAHEEVVLMWGGPKETILEKLGIANPDAK